MAKYKKAVRTVKKPLFPTVLLPLRFVLIFLSTIGDTVIYFWERAFFLLKKAITFFHIVLIHFVPQIRHRQFVGKFPPFFFFLQKTSSLSPNKGLIFSYGQKGKKYPLLQLVFRLLLNTYFSVVSIIKYVHQVFASLYSKFYSLKEQLQKYISSLLQTIQILFQVIFLPRINFPTVQLPKIRFAKPRIRLIRPRFPPVFVGMMLGVFLMFFLVFIPLFIYWNVSLLPNPRLLSQRVIPVTTQIFDRRGVLLYEFHGDEDRKPLPLAEIPDLIKKATIAIEDKTFYSHPGFSITGIARAARETFVNHHTQGGSTITQQLVKNALLSPEISWQRKIRELVLAFWAERIYTKDQILEMYLNQVPYGGTAWGIEAAAKMYFGKSVKELNLAESAYISGLPAAPTLYSPYGARPELAVERQSEVLHRMLEEGFITEKEMEAALAIPLGIKPQIVNIKAPHFVMYIRQLLTQKYGARLVDQGGLRITTTLDADLQEKVEAIVAHNIAQLTRLKVGNGAALVTDPKTGDILTMVGSKNYFDEAQDGNVNVVLSVRQPGSSIKPLTYALALTNGFTATTLLEDLPIAFAIPGQQPYTPVNYDSRFHGIVTLRAALANSYNITAVRTLNRLGVKNLIQFGKKMGITTWEDESRFGLSLTLGGGEVTLLDMNTMYGVFANGGTKIPLDPLLKVTDYTGKVYYEKGAPDGESVISPAVSYIITSILSDNAARTPAFGPNSALVVPNKTVAVKTGTTNDKRDNLTFGFTPNFVVGVWVGNNNNTPMDPYLTSGITGAAPIWNQIMQELLRNRPDQSFQKPDTIVTFTCFGKTEYYVKGTEPKNCLNIPSPSPTLTKNT